MVPLTKTDFPLMEVGIGAVPEPGTSSSTSFAPDTCNTDLPFEAITSPETVAVESFIVNPFFVIASFNCFNVVVLPGFIFTVATPLFRLTSTESTPETDFKDTRTACAQTSQSIPKMVMSMDLISAPAEATNSNKVEHSAINLFISSPSVSAETANS